MNPKDWWGVRFLAEKLKEGERFDTACGKEVWAEGEVCFLTYTDDDGKQRRESFTDTHEAVWRLLNIMEGGLGFGCN